jgi:UV DNA damage endonuclease
MARLGLVCLTSDKKISYRTIQKTRFDKLDLASQYSVLYDIYRYNKAMLKTAIAYCVEHGIQMYRMSSEMFPFSDTPIGKQVMKEGTISLDSIGKFSIQSGVRITCHPGQYTTLVSDSLQSIRNSVDALLANALVFDYMGLPENHWAPIIIHGGKKECMSKLISTIPILPSSISNRLVLENDEYSYSIDSLLGMQEFLRIPIVFDVHHHLVNQKLESYDDLSMSLALEGARITWPDPDMQVVHLSSGKDSLHDRTHNDFIKAVPACLIEHVNKVPWIEVEAKAKELAIFDLRARFPGILV